MTKKYKHELLPSIAEIEAMVRRKEQGISEPGEEKRRVHEMWVGRVVKAEAKAKKEAEILGLDNDYEDN